MKDFDNFKKNGLTYKLLQDGGFKLLFALFDGNVPQGYEVVREYYHTLPFDQSVRRVITPNHMFGKDGSKSFYTQRNAQKYFNSLTPSKPQKDNEAIRLSEQFK